ncbi:MAG TPA: phosphoribosylanthranilate isomerase [Acidobacteriaceae bacterium]
MWIKICANTNLQDALRAAEAGADAVGYVFASSPRQVTPGQAATIAPELPPDVTQIGIFNTQDFEEIQFALQTAGLHGVQLHGELDFQLAERLRNAFDPSFFLVQSLHWSLDRDPAASERTLRDELRAIGRHRAADAVLVDTRTATASGGTGKVFDWERARDVLAAESGKVRIILAGGLTPENVAEAIRALRPWGVDVASGVESFPGRKDPVRLHAFIRAARAAFAAIENVPPVTQSLS